MAAPPGSAEGMAARIESLARDAPLYRYIFRGHLYPPSIQHRLHESIKREVLIHSPTGGAMIHDYLSLGITTDIVRTLASFGPTSPNAKVTKYDIVRVDIKRIVCYANPVARR